MTTLLKASAIIGTGAALALGISTTEPTSPNVVTPSAVVTHETTETKLIANPDPVIPVTKAIPKPTVTETKPVSNCHPGYAGCLKINAGDYDCAGGTGNGPNYTGPVQVYGSDPFGLDRDNDGWGCED